MASELSTLTRKVDQILDILVGNGLTEEKGLVGKVDEVDERIKKLEKFKDKALWILMGMALPGGVGVAKILGAIAEAIHK